MKDVGFGVSLTQPQRIVIAELFPQLVDRLKLDVNRQVKIEFTVSLMKAIWWCAGEAVPRRTCCRDRHPPCRTHRGSRCSPRRFAQRCIIATFRQAIQDAHGIAAIASSKRLYQFKITLLDIAPVIWRRIQIKNGSVDKLHECIQTAMGWTNSHLHRFEIQGIVCGDPELISDDPESFVGTNSLETMVG